MTTKEALGTTLAALVKERGIRHPELARRVGVSSSSIRAYLRGDVFPNKHIDAILAELDVSPARFLSLAAGGAMASRQQGGSREYVVTDDDIYRICAYVVGSALGTKERIGALIAVKRDLVLGPSRGHDGP